MTTKEEWLALAERCEDGVSGLDVLHLAWAIMRACGYKPLHRSDWVRGKTVFFGTHVTFEVEGITRLIEQELPEHEVYSHLRWGGDGNGGVCKMCVGGINFRGKNWSSLASSEVFARCGVFCRAMAEKAGEQ